MKVVHKRLRMPVPEIKQHAHMHACPATVMQQDCTEAASHPVAAAATAVHGDFVREGTLLITCGEGVDTAVCVVRPHNPGAQLRKMQMFADIRSRQRQYVCSISQSDVSVKRADEWQASAQDSTASSTAHMAGCSLAITQAPAEAFAAIKKKRRFCVPVVVEMQAKFAATGQLDDLLPAEQLSNAFDAARNTLRSPRVHLFLMCRLHEAELLQALAGRLGMLAAAKCAYESAEVSHYLDIIQPTSSQRLTNPASLFSQVRCMAPSHT